MTSESEHNPRTAHDPIEELRRELETGAAGPRVGAEELSRITDVFIVRHPGRAGDFHRELDRVCAASGITSAPSLATAASSPDEERTVQSARPAPAGQGSSRATPPPDSPATIGRCRVLRELGRGGMGMVLLGHDPMLRRRVAIKVLPAEFARDPVLVERFRREAAAVAELEHRAIVPIYEIGEQDGLHYYVMRFVDGSTLRDWCRERMKLDESTEGSSHRRGARALLRTTARFGNRASFSIGGLGDVLRAFEDIARGLHHAHEHGIIHRDIKPANVMVDGQGFAQLLDFGLARFDREATMTRSGLLLGTVAYMAPEQIAAAYGRVDARSDIFALGVSLFECLTGTRPFMGETAEATLQLILSAEAPSPLVFVPELSRDIETIIHKCLEKRPQRRYQSALELAEDLARVRAHERIEAQPIGPLGRVLRWAERHRRAATAGIIAALAVVALAAVIIGGALMRRVRAAESLKTTARGVEDRLDRLEDMLAEGLPRQGDSRAGILVEIAAAAAELRRVESLDREPAAASFAASAARIPGLLRRLAPVGDRDLKGALRGLLVLLDPDADPRGHGTLSLAIDPPGAEVVIRDRRGAIIERASGSLEGIELAAGSYLAEVSAPGRISVRYPLLILRDEHWGDPSFAGGAFGERDWTLRLPEAGSFASDDFALIAAGPYLATRDRDHFGAEPALEWRWLDDFVIARDELRAADWQPFLADEAILEEIENRPDPNRLIYLPRLRPNQPSDYYLDASAGPEDIQKGRLRIKDEARELALGGISWTDARRYLAWRGATTGDGVDLPTAAQWEKAARGVDGRLFPWGDDFDWSRVRGPEPGTMLGRLPGRPGEAPQDVSPYGLRDMAGNLREWCRDGGELGDGEINPYLAGGDCSSAGGDPGWFMSWPRSFLPRDNVAISWGFRVVKTGDLR